MWKMKLTTILSVSVLLWLVFSCAPRLLYKPYNPQTIQTLYASGVGDAAKPQPWEISNKLVPIRAENTELVWREIKGESYLLVSSWQADTIYYTMDSNTGFYNTGKYPIWVTVAPQLQRQCQDPKFGRREGLDLRLNQLLGLPPEAGKKYFVEFWVRPQDLFRPCPDAEVEDNTCGLAFPDQVTDSHRTWINDLRIQSYYHAEWNKNYPWTELGYTYDWNRRNKSHQGLSEFVIGKNKNIIVAGFYSTMKYCQPKNK